MGVRASSDDAGSPADVCRTIDSLLERLARLSTSDAAPERFLVQLLAAAMREAEAIGGAIWAANDCVLERFTDEALTAAPRAARNVARLQLIKQVIDGGISATAIIDWTTPAGTTGRFVSVCAPFAIDRDARGCFELLLSVASPPSVQERTRGLTEAFAELVADYFTRRQIADLRQREIHWQSLSNFLEAIHRPALRECAVAIANEGRWFCQCDRVSVLYRQRSRCKVLAVSGVDRIDARSSLVACLEELADHVLKTGEALWEVGQPMQRPPPLEAALDNYFEQSHSRAIVALPLISRSSGAITNTELVAPTGPVSQCSGILVLEWFAPPAIDESARERIELVARHGASALSVAHATERLPLIAINRALAKIAWIAGPQQLPRALWIAGLMAAFLLALVFVPADFDIAADGELQPLERREVFAPSDAVVDEILVEHGDKVSAGQALLRLRSAALDLESARLRGEIQTTEKRLAAIRWARFERDTEQSTTAHRRLALTAEEEELKESLASLRRQEQILTQERALLEVRSPLDGEVLTPDVARSLAARPVERGQSLLSVGKVEGRWSLELAVPDEQIGYVLAAAEEAHRDGAALPVSFLLVGEPGVTYQGYVERIERRAHVDEKSGKPVVEVVAQLDEAIDNARPGAAVVGKIYCGRRSLGFVWLHDAWNSVRRRLLF